MTSDPSTRFDPIAASTGEHGVDGRLSAWGMVWFVDRGAWGPGILGNAGKRSQGRWAGGQAASV